MIKKEILIKKRNFKLIKKKGVEGRISVGIFLIGKKGK
ncbi:hypothetical protein AsAng_0022370 [Aureispira anguillae]|uniref:Uncharacterized protein n=1 Tax=Aureispira anguillae TaxID=2864201 RepID=A0A915YEH0_9BACT|nr:hypothetical protein AsAng_0022370 [Aureispira anguillae]